MLIKCDYGRHHLESAPSDILADLGVTKCNGEGTGGCCSLDEICKCNGAIQESFPLQCSIEPTYCEPNGKI